MYSMQAVARLTGLRPETLRVWERRYRVVQPQRNARGWRRYTPADVYRLSLLQQATARGHPIGDLVALSVEQLRALLAGPGEPAPRPPPPSEPLAVRLVEAAAAYDVTACDTTLGLALVSLSPRAVVLDVLMPALQTVGDLWCRGEMAIAQEHLLTATIQRALMATLHTLQKAAHGPRLVLGTLSGEHHDLGLLCAAFLATHHGWRCHYLGMDVPAAELARVVHQVGAAVVGVSVTITDQAVPPSTQLRDLHALVQQRAEVWLGGAAVPLLTPSDLPAGCILMTDVRHYEERLLLLRTQQPW